MAGSQARELFQEAMKDDPTTWGAPISENLDKRFRNYYKQLGDVSEIRIPRFVEITKDSRLVVAADASARAMGSVIYLLTPGEDGRFKTFFIQGRSKLFKTGDESSISKKELRALVAASGQAVKVTELLLKHSTFKNSHPPLLLSDSSNIVRWLTSGIPHKD